MPLQAKVSPYTEADSCCGRNLTYDHIALLASLMLYTSSLCDIERKTQGWTEKEQAKAEEVQSRHGF